MLGPFCRYSVWSAWRLPLITLLIMLGLACGGAPAAETPAPAAPASQPAPSPTTPPPPSEATPVIATAVPAPAPTEDEPQYGGILRNHAGDDLVDFDQMTQTTVRTQQRVGGSYNRLFRFSFDETGVVVPDLAEKFEASPDGLTYTLQLRSGVKFHNIPGVPGSGTDFECQDVVHTLDKYRDPEWSDRSSDLIAVESVECGADPLHVVLKLSQPDAGLISMLAAGWAGMIPSELPYEDMKTTVIGTGPFVWKEYIRGSKSVTEKNPDYWREGLPYLDGIENFVFPEETASFAAFRAQQLDVNSLMQYIYPAEKQILEEQHPEVLVSLPPRLWWHYFYGKMDDPIWSKPKVREALSLAIDRPGAVAILGEGVGSVGGWQAPWTSWSLPEAELENYLGKLDSSDMEARRERARQLLEEAGYPPGTLKLTAMGLNTRESMLTPTYMEDQFRRIGVELTLDPVDRAAYTERLDRRDFQLNGSGSAVAPLVNPSLFYGNYFLCDAPANYAGYCNPEFDNLFKQQLSEQDEAKRQQIVWEMERRLLEDRPGVLVRWVAEGMAWWPWVKNWKDVDPAYYNNVTLEEVWLDQNHPLWPSRP
jgi:peptide/nickel transport system substrate-binding protein